MAKKYNPWTGFLEDTAAKANDASPVVGKKYTIRGKEFKVLEVKGDNVKVLGSDGIVSHLNIKMFDEKPTIDNAIRNMDSAKSDAREVYNILAQALQNSTNPNKVSELISKAQGKLLEMSARAKDSKCKPTIDKAIRNCDKIEFDPQDTRYIKKAIGSLKVANSLLGMINEKTVNNAKQNIASTISLLEGIC